MRQDDFNNMATHLLCSMPVLGSYMDLVRPGWGNKRGHGVLKMGGETMPTDIKTLPLSLAEFGLLFFHSLPLFFLLLSTSLSKSLSSILLSDSQDFSSITLTTFFFFFFHLILVL